MPDLRNLKESAPGTSSLSTATQHGHLKPLITSSNLKLTSVPKAETLLHELAENQESLTHNVHAVACVKAILHSQSANDTALLQLWPDTLVSLLKILHSGGAPMQLVLVSALPDH